MPKRIETFNSWFNHKLFDEICKKIQKDKKDMRKFSHNLGVSYDTIYKMRKEMREPMFTIVAMLSKLTKIPIEEFIVIPDEFKFVNMNKEKCGRKYKSSASVEKSTARSYPKKVKKI